MSVAVKKVNWPVGMECVSNSKNDTRWKENSLSVFRKHKYTYLWKGLIKRVFTVNNTQFILGMENKEQRYYSKLNVMSQIIMKSRLLYYEMYNIL